MMSLPPFMFSVKPSITKYTPRPGGPATFCLCLFSRGTSLDFETFSTQLTVAQHCRLWLVSIRNKFVLRYIQIALFHFPRKPQEFSARLPHSLAMPIHVVPLSSIECVSLEPVHWIGASPLPLPVCGTASRTITALGTPHPLQHNTVRPQLESKGAQAHLVTG